MNKTQVARDLLPLYPATQEGRYQAASDLMSQLGISRNYARRLIHAALHSSPTRGGMRPGAGRRPTPPPKHKRG